MCPTFALFVMSLLCVCHALFMRVCLRSSARLKAQADGLDVNVPNGGSAAALMLAVRDVDLLQSAVAPLSWDHRTVEVVKTLLGLSA